MLSIVVLTVVFKGCNRSSNKVKFMMIKDEEKGEIMAFIPESMSKSGIGTVILPPRDMISGSNSHE